MLNSLRIGNNNRAANMDKNDFLDDLPQSKPSYTPAPDGEAPGEGLVIESGTLLAERYEVKKRIGAGGMGAVFKVFDRNRDKDIAIKVLLPDLFSNEAAKERFTQEAQISSELSHPNIVNVFDIVVAGDLTFLTMELLEGQNLREYMDAQHRGMDQEEALGIIQDVVKALEYAHQSMVHRDIKPENIFICDDGTIKLMDFGIAQAQSFSRASKVGMSLGTAYYMAPEQLKAKAKVDARADQYALAVLCYELLIGELPTGAVKKPHEIKKDIPKKLSLAIMKGMEPNADERFKDILSFGAALAGKGRVSGSSSTKWLLVASVAVVVVFIGVTATGLMRSNTEFAVIAQEDTGIFTTLKETFFPDPAIEQEAIALSAELETLAKAIERSEKQLKEKKQETKAEVNRIGSYLRTAKGEEKEALTNSLNQVEVEAEAANIAHSLFTELSTSSDQFIEGQKQKATGEALLKSGKFKEAVTSFYKAKKELNKISSISDELHQYVLNKAQINAFKNDVITFNDENDKAITDLSGFIEAVTKAFREAGYQADNLRFKNASDVLDEFTAFRANWNEIRQGFIERNIESLTVIYKNCDYALGSRYNYCHIPDDLAFAIAKEKNSISAYGLYAMSNGVHTELADELSANRMDTLKTYDALEVYMEWFPQGMYIDWVKMQLEEKKQTDLAKRKAEQRDIELFLNRARTIIKRYYGSFKTLEDSISFTDNRFVYSDAIFLDFNDVSYESESKLVEFDVEITRFTDYKVHPEDRRFKTIRSYKRTLSLKGVWSVPIADFHSDNRFIEGFGESIFTVVSYDSTVNDEDIFRSYNVGSSIELNEMFTCQITVYDMKDEQFFCKIEDGAQHTIGKM